MATASTSSWRWLAAAAFLAMPVLTLWNAAVPNHAITIGPSLIGVTKTATPEFSLHGFLDGALQKAAAAKIADALPLRRMLIRLNNQIVYSLFGEVNAPDLLVGRHGQFVQRSYLAEYCGRRSGDADRLADATIPLLRDIQAVYRARGAVFLYVVTPSKVASLPQDFTHLVACPSTAPARAELLPRYVARLRDAGIAIVDTATPTHARQDGDPVAPFAHGGIHWNDLAMARAAQQIVEAVNAQAGRELLPSFGFTATFSRPPGGRDRDLADLANLLASPVDDPTPKLVFTHPPCADQPARSIDAAIVGGSFMDAVGEVLTADACLSRLNQYFYLRLGRYGGATRELRQADLSDADLAALRDVGLMLLEENESSIGRQGYLPLLHQIVTAK
jgi:hypothetical protein